MKSGCDCGLRGTLILCVCAPDMSCRTYALNFKSSRSDTAVFHFSFFTIHHSLFPLGAVTIEKPPRGVYRAYWERHTAGSRREMEAGTARWESHAAGSRREMPAGAPRPPRRIIQNTCGICADILQCLPLTSCLRLWYNIKYRNIHLSGSPELFCLI